MSSIVRVLQSAYNYCFNATPAPKENLVEALATQRVLVRFLGTKEFGLIGAMLPYEKIQTLAKCFAIIDYRGQEIIPLVLRHPACFIINAFNSLAHDEQSQRTYLIDRIHEICATKNRIVSATLVADPYIANALRRIPLAELVYTNSESFLAIAALNGHVEAVRELLKGGVIPEADHGWAVRIAAFNGHVEMVRGLLEDGAVISQDDRGMAVREAAQNGHLEVVQVLLAGSAVISAEMRGQAVCAAAQQGHIAVVRMLLENGAVISRERREEALYGTARDGHVAVVRELLNGGANLRRPEMPVAAAARYGHAEVVRELLSGGAVISQNDRRYLLSGAFFKGDYDVVRELLKDAPTSTRLYYLPFLAVSSCCGARRKG
jgi:hypothetical protein